MKVPDWDPDVWIQQPGRDGETESVRCDSVPLRGFSGLLHTVVEDGLQQRLGIGGQVLYHDTCFSGDQVELFVKFRAAVKHCCITYDILSSSTFRVRGAVRGGHFSIL